MMKKYMLLLHFTLQIILSLSTSFDSRDLYKNNSNILETAFYLSPCPPFEIQIEITMQMEYPKDNYWTLSKLDTGEVLWSDDGSNTHFNEARCFPDDSYKFIVYDEFGDGIISGYYALLVNNITLTEGWQQSPEVFFSFKETIICSSDEDCGNSCPVQYCNLLTRGCEINETFSESCRNYGTPSALALRVVANDAYHSSTLEEIRSYLFGMSSQLLSMSKQFYDCSFGKFHIQPFFGQTSSGATVENGAFEISLPRLVAGEQVSSIVTEVLSVAESTLGNLLQFDFLLLCMPPGMQIGDSLNWKAYAYVNNANSIYNDGQCSSLSVLMHELGHNVGLSHSNDEKNYGDESGMQGISLKDIGGPKRCFNGAKSWQLGWYHNGHRILDFGSGILFEAQEQQIIGLASSSGSEKPTIYKLIGTGDGFDYYFTFNEKVGFNSGTREGANQILIVRRPTGSDYADSTLISKLSPGEKKTILYIADKFDLDAEFTSIANDGTANFRIGRLEFEYRKCWEDSHCDDKNTCTEDRCDTYEFTGTCNYNQVDCDLCGKQTEMQVKTNTFPGAVQWSIQNIDTGRFFMVSKLYSKQNTDYKSSYCLPHGKYAFSFSYEENKTVTAGAEFSLQVGDVKIDGGIFEEQIFFESYFIICGSNDDCFDFDGCTIDICNITTKLCNNTQFENDQECMNCSWLSLNITTDNFPEETTWGLYHFTDPRENTNNEFVFTGNPYSFDVGTAFGRSKAPTRSGRRKAPTRAGRRKAPTRSSASLQDRDIERRRLNEDYEISETICIENELLFYFLIEDSFGDGICCTEGRGGYSLLASSQVLQSGGDFKDSEDLLFQFKNCNSATDCNDDDICTSDECNGELNICTFTKRPCSECGLPFQVDIHTDNDPTQTIWRLKKDNQQLLQIGPLESPNFVERKNLCLSLGSYTFRIYDTAADGIIKGGYNISLGGQVIGSGSEFGQMDEVFFVICELDNDCNDGDICTVDYCNEQRKICVFEALPCEKCSAGRVQVAFETYLSFSDSRWEIKRDGNTNNVMRGGPYLNQISFSDTECLLEGFYHFHVYPLNGAETITYAVYVNEELMVSGSITALDAIEPFYVTALSSLPSVSLGPSSIVSKSPSLASTSPSINPTLSSSPSQPPAIPSYPSSIPSDKPSSSNLSLLPSVAPSTFRSSSPSSPPSFFSASPSIQVINSLSPSNTPSFTFQFPSNLPSFSPSEEFGSSSPSSIDDIDNWFIHFKEAKLQNENSTTLDGLLLYYRVSKGKNSTQLLTQIFDANCQYKSERVDLFNATSYAIKDDKNMHDIEIVQLAFNETIVKETNLWNQTSETQGTFAFCVRTSFVLNGMSVSFAETKFHEIYDFDSDFSDFQVNMGKNEESVVDHSAKLKVTSCICSNEESTYECKDKNEALHQDSEFLVCVFPPATLKVTTFEDMVFYQDGIAKFIAVENEVIHLLGQMILGYDTGVISLRLPARFFFARDPSPVRIMGSVKLDFISSRLLLENTLAIEEMNAAKFEMVISLEASPSDRYLGIVWCFSALFIFLFSIYVLKIRTKKIAFVKLKNVEV